MEKLKVSEQIVVGTPGRVADMLSRKALVKFVDEKFKFKSKTCTFLKSNHFPGPKSIKMFVLDEADKFLSRGFKEQTHDVFRKMPDNIQVIIFSDKMPIEILEMTKKYTRDPTRILVVVTIEGTKQFYLMVNREVGPFISYLISQKLFYFSKFD